MVMQIEHDGASDFTHHSKARRVIAQHHKPGFVLTSGDNSLKSGGPTFLTAVHHRKILEYDFVRILRLPYLNGGIWEGKPTRMKYRAKACEKCSRKGESNRHLFPDASALFFK